MTFRLDEKYNAFAPGPNYPVRGSILNDSAPGAKDGTALDNQWKDDERAIWEILLQNANITPSGFVDTALASDHYEAFVYALSRTSINGLYKNLTSSVPTSSTVQIDVEEVLLTDSNGFFLKLESVSQVADIENPIGASGLDTGVEASDTWYYPWLIAKEDGTAALMFSTSLTSPTMPAEYTYKSLVCAPVYNNSVSDFNGRRQADYSVGRPSNLVLNTSVSQATYTALDLSLIIPINAKVIEGTFSTQNNVGTASSLRISPEGDTQGEKEIFNQSTAGPVGLIRAPYRLDIKEAQTLYWENAGSNPDSRIYISKYSLKGN